MTEKDRFTVDIIKFLEKTKASLCYYERVGWKIVTETHECNGRTIKEAFKNALAEHKEDRIDYDS